MKTGSQLKRGTFRQQSLEEVKEKQVLKLARLKTRPQNALGRKKKLKATRSGWSTNRKGEAVKIKKNRKVHKGRSISKLKITLDSCFSQFIRLSYADYNGMVKCYTCSRVKHWKEMQNGHFVPRQHLALRWDENNCRPQEAGCNVYGHGMVFEYEQNLKAELGNDFVEDMKLKRHLTTKLDRNYYEYWIKFYTQKVEEIKLYKGF